MVYDGGVKAILQRESSAGCEIILDGDLRSALQPFKCELIGAGMTKLIVKREDKKLTLNNLLKKEIEIISIKDLNPTLEEIIYHRSRKR